MAYGIDTFDSFNAPMEAYVENPTSGTTPVSESEQTEFFARASELRNAGTLPDDYIQRAGYEVRNNPEDGSATLLKKFDDLALTENEAEWARTHRSEARDRAFRNGDMETVALRAMLEYAKSGASDGRSIEQIKGLAWRVRRNRDIAAAKRAAARLQAEGVRDASWEKGYIPTTRDMLFSTVSEYTPADPRVPGSKGRIRDVPVREAVLRELNDAARASDYSPLMRARAAYLAERFGFRPVTQVFDPLVPDGSSNVMSSNVLYRFDTGEYRLATPEELNPAGPSWYERNRAAGMVVLRPDLIRDERNTWNRWAWGNFAGGRKAAEIAFNRKYRRRGTR